MTKKKAEPTEVELLRDENEALRADNARLFMAIKRVEAWHSPNKETAGCAGCSSNYWPCETLQVLKNIIG